MIWHQSKTAIQKLYFSSAGLSAPGRKSTLFASFASADRVLLFGLLMGCCNRNQCVSPLLFIVTAVMILDQMIKFAWQHQSVLRGFNSGSSSLPIDSLFVEFSSPFRKETRNQLDHHLSWSAGQESEARLDNLACVFKVWTLCTRYIVEYCVYWPWRGTGKPQTPFSSERFLNGWNWCFFLMMLRLYHLNFPWN